jgi:predicted RNA binding protein YcfA (HicA-like mRNA interferase family)
MASLPVVSGLEAIRAFERAGWRRARQKGSHVSLVKSGVNVICPCLFTGSWTEALSAN